MTSHDGLDSLCRLIRVVKGDRADIVVQNVSLDNTVEKPAADEAELAVDCRSGTFDEGPLVARVVGQRWVGVLEEGDSNCRESRVSPKSFFRTSLSGKHLPSQWLTQR